MVRRIVGGLLGAVLLGAAAGAGDLATAADAGDEPESGRTDRGRTADILERVTAAYGGSELIAASHGWRMRGRVLSVSDGVNGALDLDLALDGSMRLEIRYPNRTEVRIVAGLLAWHGGGKKQRAANRQMADSMKLQYHRLVAPFELAGADPGDLEDEGDTPGGRVSLRRRWNGRTSTVYEIDPESGRVLVVRGEIVSEDGEMEFTSEASDFRDVEGIPFPFRITTLIDGEVAAETILDRISPESAFEPHEFLPAGGYADL